MIRNHLKIAWRSLKKRPFFSLLNVFGLTIGMAGALLIGLYIYDEFGYDKMFADTNRIYRLNADIKFGGVENATATLPPPLAKVLQDDFPQIETVTRFHPTGGVFVKKNGTQHNVKEQNATYVDASLFDMFGIDLLVGDKETALREPNTVVLTKTAAEKHFSVEKALNQVLVLNNGDTYTVTGVIDDLPKNSLLRDYSVFMAMAGYADAKTANWGGHNYNTFIKLLPNAKIEDVDKGLPAIVDTKVLQWAQTVFPGITKEQFAASGNYIKYSTIALTDIRLHSDRRAEMNANNDLQNIYILSFIALFLIVLASINFMNLSTANSLQRAKEVGIRKTLGSNRTALVWQFLTESGLISFASLLAALGLTFIALPYFNTLADKQLSVPVGHPAFWGVILIATLILGILSGSYPAFFLSRFVPVKVLSGNASGGIEGGRLRNGLVVFQFAISVFLIVATLVVYGQLHFIQQRDLGYSKDQVVVINDIYTLGNGIQSFKNEVTDLAQVQHATVSAYYPTPSTRSENSFFEEGASDQEKAVSMQQWKVDYDYVPTLGLQIVAGRDFDRERATDSTAMLINESTLKVMGRTADEVIGKRFLLNFDSEDQKLYTVIGILKDFHYRTLRTTIDPLSLTIGNEPSAMAIKLRTGDFGEALAQVKSIWDKAAPGQPFDYYFMNASFDDTYKSDERLGTLFVIFTVLSILVACLGLFGLATFNAARRTKEIGVRKVLGASVGQISLRLATDFLKMVLLAIMIALPVGWFVMDRWLQDFTYRMDIPWWMMLAAALLAISIALITVSYQSIKAARTNPVKSLRTE